MNTSIIVYKNSYVLTRNGYFLIEDLNIKHQIEIWEENKWSLVNIKKYNHSVDDIYKILLSDGCEVLCSNLQRLNTVANINSETPEIQQIENIKLNNLLYTYNFPIVEGSEKYNILYPYTHGYYCGCLNKINKQNMLIFESNLTYINLEKDKQKIKSKIEISGKYSIDKLKNTTIGLLKIDMDQNITVPINGNIENKLLWLSGLIDNNGFITKLKDAKYLNISVLTKKFATEIKFLFNTLGINPNIYLKSDIRKFKSNLNEISEKICNYWVITLNSEDTNKIFIDYDLKLYYLEYNKLIYSIDQSINRYLSIKKINKMQLKKESYIIKNINSCVINGVLIF